MCRIMRLSHLIRLISPKHRLFNSFCSCPVDNSIFPSFYQVGNALESSYEAFRFTESYGVIFQCNVKYCIGKCEPVICGVGRDNVESWGRRRRSVATVEEKSDEEMTLSKEILVLDVNNENLDNVNSMRDTKCACMRGLF